MDESANDPLFMEDLKQNMDAFEYTDDDATKEFSKW